MSAVVSAVRQEWQEGHRRLQQEAVDRKRHLQLLDQVEAVGAVLRRRIGDVFTIAELAAAYRDAEAWSREVVADHAVSSDWPRTLSVVVAAAFHLHSRGAVDYEP